VVFRAFPLNSAQLVIEHRFTDDLPCALGKIIGLDRGFKNASAGRALMRLARVQSPNFSIDSRFKSSK
jgi:hypothetical protein